MSSKPEVDSSWHERGELPPAGCECEVMYRGEWIKTMTVGVDSSGYCVFEVPEYMLDKPPYDGLHEQAKFRPLRTEREKAIDEMVSVILDYDGYMMTSATAELMARQLYDSGYHK